MTQKDTLRSRNQLAIGAISQDTMPQTALNARTPTRRLESSPPNANAPYLEASHQANLALRLVLDLPLEQALDGRAQDLPLRYLIHQPQKILVIL